jgi:hypothetical protein
MIKGRKGEISNKQELTNSPIASESHEEEQKDLATQI